MVLGGFVLDMDLDEAAGGRFEAVCCFQMLQRCVTSWEEHTVSVFSKVY